MQSAPLAHRVPVGQDCWAKAVITEEFTTLIPIIEYDRLHQALAQRIAGLRGTTRLRRPQSIIADRKE